MSLLIFSRLAPPNEECLGDNLELFLHLLAQVSKTLLKTKHRKGSVLTEDLRAIVLLIILRIKLTNFSYSQT